MTTPAFGTIEADPLDREGDRWGRPKIVPPNGGKGVRYTRVSTFAKAIEDTEFLMKWKVRTAMLGMAHREDIIAAVSTLTADPEDRDALNELAEKAVEAGQGTVKRDLGTALHTMTEQLDRGERKVRDFPKQYQASLQSYLDELDRCGLQPMAAEMFVVHDEFKCAGTYDRLLLEKATGELLIGDVKTGSIQALSTAVQVAVYAHSRLYDKNTGERIDYPVPPSHTRGVFMHLPQGENRAEFHRLDLETGWAAAKIIKEVRGVRYLKPIAPWTVAS